MIVMLDEEPKTGQAEVSRTLTDAMQAAGVHPAYVYAVKRCGFIYTDENADALTDDQVESWHAAVEDWFDQNPTDGG